MLYDRNWIKKNKSFRIPLVIKSWNGKLSFAVKSVWFEWGEWVHLFIYVGYCYMGVLSGNLIAVYFLFLFLCYRTLDYRRFEKEHVLALKCQRNSLTKAFIWLPGFKRCNSKPTQYNRNTMFIDQCHKFELLGITQISCSPDTSRNTVRHVSLPNPRLGGASVLLCPHTLWMCKSLMFWET